MKTPFFCFDPGNGISFFETAAEAKEACETAFEAYESEASINLDRIWKMTNKVFRHERKQP